MKQSPDRKLLGVSTNFGFRVYQAEDLKLLHVFEDEKFFMKVASKVNH